jgi:subtilisin family serine protease
LFNTNGEPWGDDPRPIVIDEARNARWVAYVQALGARFRSAGVRLVNMSWSYTVDEVEDGLLRHGGETDRARARTRATAMHAAADAALRQLIAECPGTLFVAAAGNSNQSDDILAASPQTIRAPNLIVVGATGTNGTPTGFTTYGKNVGIYAWGQDVPLRVPGGMIDHWQGTSMAAPLVVRAAAQMLAMNAKLTPPQLIAGLQSSATTDAAGLKLLHPANAVAWARVH